jgi:hypothetical protein
VIGVNLDVLAECGLLVNSSAELGLACMLGQELGLFTSIVELLYIKVQLGRAGGWRLCPYPLGREKMCSLLAWRLRLRHRREAHVLIEAWRLSPALSL